MLLLLLILQVIVKFWPGKSKDGETFFSI